MSAPPIPKLDNDVDLMLDIFTHSSLRYPNAPLNDDYGDTARLADLGAKILDAVVSYHFFAHKPNKTVAEIQEERKTILGPTNLSAWLDTYGLKNKLRANPSEIEAILADPAEMAHFFHIYVGALYIRNGLAPVQTWISALIDPTVEVVIPGPPSAQQPTAHHQHQPPLNLYQMYGMQQHGMQGQQALQGMQEKGMQYDQGSFYGGASSSGKPPSYGQQSYHGYSPAPSHSSFASPPPQPNEPPPPTPSGAPPPQPPPPAGAPPPFGYSAASTLSLVSLALVNQTASQQGISVTYPAEQTGPPHLPTWTVRCCMNGIERGRGVGKSMKVAKEEAARQAWAAMGWGPS
ncbi:hypothetical protein D9619_002795 [Psilocybe cf. subviscida]|uniref:RNase III domain-containing protein n=1 Tax=Psilocybe cf. subviscida TaxID=2480587 RepID=A0A8H5AX51_9AGAR|nr:hypothetical protein D9619_002795 [Psilocybe cf. subviscida]